PRVEHRRRDGVVVPLHRLLELLDRGVLRAGFDEDFGRRAPDDGESIALVARLEIAKILAELLREIALRLPFLDVVAVDARDVLVVEHGGHRLDAAQEVGDRLEIAFLEHAGFLCRGVGVARNRIPRAEHDVVERRERYEVLDQRRAVFSALAEPDRRHLREGPNRLRVPATNALDAGHERRSYGAEPRRENAKRAGGR